ncbi:MAG: hypothetical protein IPP77_07760 [Bacteroidetes bacterium]|nr:hypothetical protein [Bacteroidota bacterium]
MLIFSCINFTHSKIHPLFDGQIIRTSYLVGDAALVAGSSVMGVDAEQGWSNPSGQFKKAMIMDFARHEPNPRFLKDVEIYYEARNKMRHKVKHETKEMIVARKKVEHAMDVLYEEAVKRFKESFARAGYLGLMPLVEANEIILHGSSVEMPESIERDAKAYSENLRDYWTDKTDGYAFTLPFWDYVSEANIVVSDIDEADENAEVLTFRLPDLPALTAFTAAELKSIKQDLFPHPEMRKAIEDWHHILMKEDFGPENFDAYRNYFSTHLLDYVQEAEKKAAENMLLNRVRAQLNQKSRTENFLSICPAEIVWDYLEWCGMIPKESVEAFKKNMPENCTGEKAVLILVNKPELLKPEEEMYDKQSLEL